MRGAKNGVEVVVMDAGLAEVCVSIRGIDEYMFQVWGIKGSFMESSSPL